MTYSVVTLPAQLDRSDNNATGPTRYYVADDSNTPASIVAEASTSTRAEEIVAALNAEPV